MPRPGQMIITVFMLALAWTVIQFSLTLPILNHLTVSGRTSISLQVSRGPRHALIFLALTWTLAAVGEETLYRPTFRLGLARYLGSSAPGLCWVWLCLLRCSR